jgi:putative FmdB family regulatory protein
LAFFDGMPIYEFDCSECGARFDELVAGEAAVVACPKCGSSRVSRRISTVAPPSRQPRGVRVREGEARRRERESARQERMSESRRKRAGGEA